MRREKSNLVYYIAAILILAALGFVMVHEFPLEQEHVEEIIK